MSTPILEFNQLISSLGFGRTSSGQPSPFEGPAVEIAALSPRFAAVLEEVKALWNQALGGTASGHFAAAPDGLQRPGAFSAYSVSEELHPGEASLPPVRVTTAAVSFEPDHGTKSVYPQAETGQTALSEALPVTTDHQGPAAAIEAAVVAPFGALALTGEMQHADGRKVRISQGEAAFQSIQDPLVGGARMLVPDELCPVQTNGSAFRLPILSADEKSEPRMPGKDSLSSGSRESGGVAAGGSGAPLPGDGVKTQPASVSSPGTVLRRTAEGVYSYPESGKAPPEKGSSADASDGMATRQSGVDSKPDQLLFLSNGEPLRGSDSATPEPPQTGGDAREQPESGRVPANIIRDAAPVVRSWRRVRNPEASPPRGMSGHGSQVFMPTGNRGEHISRYMASPGMTQPGSASSLPAGNRTAEQILAARDGVVSRVPDSVSESAAQAMEPKASPGSVADSEMTREKPPTRTEGAQHAYRHDGSKMTPRPASADSPGQTKLYPKVERAAAPTPLPTQGSAVLGAMVEEMGVQRLQTGIQRGFEREIRRSASPTRAQSVPTVSDSNGNSQKVPTPDTGGVGQVQEREPLTEEASTSTVNRKAPVGDFASRETILAARTRSAADAGTAGGSVHRQPEVILEQVARGLKMGLTQGSSEIALQLKPESLGTIRMRLAVENDIVRTIIEVENSHVRKVLESGLSRLSERLAEHGYHLDRAHVFVEGGSADRPLSSWQSRQDQGLFGREHGSGHRHPAGNNQFQRRKRNESGYRFEMVG